MEFIRIFKNKKFIAAVIFLMLLNCALFYLTQQKNVKAFETDLPVYSETFRENAGIFEYRNPKEILQKKSAEAQLLKSFADAEKMKAENPSEYEYYAGEEAALISENPGLYKEYQSGGLSYGEISALAEFYTHFANLAEYQNGYGEYISAVIENGKELSEKSLFSDKNSFSYKSIQKTINDFSANKELSLSLVNDAPVSAVLNYQTGDFILILMCVLLAVSFASQKNVSTLINSCKNGRVMLRAKQLVILLLFSLCGSFIVLTSEILLSLKIYNAPLTLFAPIQCADMFKDCVLHINFIQLFAGGIIFKAAAAAAVALLIWLPVSVSSNILFAGSIAGAAAGAELLLYKNISAQSNLSFLKTFNLFSLFDYKSVTEYNLVSVFGAPVRAELLIWVILLAAVVILCAGVLLSAKRNYPVKSPPKSLAFFSAVFKKLGAAYSKVQRAVYAGRLESFKIMHFGKGLIVFTALILAFVFSFNTNTLVFTPTEAFLNSYYENYGGELTGAAYESLAEMQAQADFVQAEFDREAERYANGEITFEEYEEARGKNAAYETQRSAAAVLSEQISRIEPLREKGITPVLLNEAGYGALFAQQSGQTEILLLLCAVCIVFSCVFPVEKESDMLMLNHCAKYGRKRLWCKKILAVIPKVLVLTAATFLFYVMQSAYHYDLRYLNADIHNLKCLEAVSLNVTIMEYLMLNYVFLLVFALCIAFTVTAVSAFVPRLAGIILSACIFVLPGALSMAGVSAAGNVSAAYLLNFNSVLTQITAGTGSFAPHIVLAAAAVVLLCLSERSWRLTKGR